MRERHNIYVIELDKDVLYEAMFKNGILENTCSKYLACIELLQTEDLDRNSI